MNRFISTVRNIYEIKELRQRILNTLLLLLIFRLGTYIVLPGLDHDLLVKKSGGVLGLLDTILGGAFSNASIFALGIMPYISASIVVQLLTVAVPYFQKMQKDGDSGRKKLNQITRVLTIAITIPQSYTYLLSMVERDAILVDPTFFYLTSVIILTAGTIFCMWLGERITDKGIGNGISMLIMIGIVSRLPAALYAEMLQRGTSGAIIFIIELVILFFIVMFVVMLTQAVRRIPVQYAKQVVGNKVYGGQRQYIPLKLNAAGVMPIIFAQSLMFLPSLAAQAFADKNETASYIATVFADIESWQYNVSFTVLIVLFTFFYTAISVNPQQIAEDMKRNGGFVPGIKPGQQTADYIDGILSRITLPGALFLSLVAILPGLASQLGVIKEFASFFGGTALLIMVGVVLDTLQQIESHLLMRHYEGLMKDGKVKGRTETVPV